MILKFCVPQTENISHVREKFMELSELINKVMDESKPQHSDSDSDEELEWYTHPFEVIVIYSSFILLISYFKLLI